MELIVAVTEKVNIHQYKMGDLPGKKIFKWDILGKRLKTNVMDQDRKQKV